MTNSDKFNDADVRHPARLTDLVLFPIQSSVIAALPMNDHGYCIADHTDDDFRGQQTNDIFACFDRDPTTVPSTLQICAQGEMAFILQRAVRAGLSEHAQQGAVHSSVVRGQMQRGGFPGRRYCTGGALEQPRNGPVQVCFPMIVFAILYTSFSDFFAITSPASIN